MISVNVFNDSELKRLPIKSVKELTARALVREGMMRGNVNIIYVTKEIIVDINKKYLKHNYITDVISFNLGEDENLLGEIYICAERALEQAEEFGTSLTKEIQRLAIHGALHLAGYEDGTDEQKELMTKLENRYLK